MTVGLQLRNSDGDLIVALHACSTQRALPVIRGNAQRRDVR